MAHIDTYDFILTAKYDEVNRIYNVAGTQAFQYVLDCDIVSLTPSTLTDTEYTFTESAVTATFDEFTPGTVCPGATIAYTWSASPDCSAIISFDETTRTFTFDGDESVAAIFALAGTSSITYTVTVTGTSGIRSADPTTFDLVVKNPCIDPALTTISVPAGLIETYTIGERKTVALPTGFISSATVCGAVVFTVTSSSTAIVYDQASESLEIETFDLSLNSSVEEVEVYAYLEDYPGIVAEPVFIYVEMSSVETAEEVKTFEVITDLPPEFAGEQQTSFEYDLSTATSDITIDIGTLTDPEGDNFTVEFTGKEPFMTPSNENGKLKVTLGYAAPGNYTLTYTVTQVIDGKTKVKTYSLDVTVTDITGSAEAVAFAGVDMSLFETVEDSAMPVQSEPPTDPDKSPPTMRISRIDLYGKVTVTFSEPFIIPANATASIN